jgi:biopolymer transport protein TolQ
MPLALLTSLPLAADARTSVLGLVLQAGPFAKGVLALLFVMSVVCWAIMWGRWRLLRGVARADESFARAFRARRGLGEVRMTAAQNPGSVLGRLAVTGLGALADRGRESGPADSGTIDLAARAMQRARVHEMEILERNLAFLATTGSVSPFLGLMGTVWGVMTAFLNIGVQGSASLIVVAPGIAEALIATLAGLAAAIPATVGYNHFVSRVRSIDNLAAAFITEFADVAAREPHAAEAHAAEPHARVTPEVARREAGV